MINIKCSICGKFISYNEIREGKVNVKFTPDSLLSSEEVEHYHKKCDKQHNK